MQNKLSHFTLRTGDLMPSIGFGCWKVPKDVLPSQIYDAIKAGYRHIDEAFDYENQKECGEGLQKALAEKLVARSDLWITSKLMFTSHRKQAAIDECKVTLKDLGL